jgi:3-deoxy-manno-octulosonate cytidylyltransferase (CMP-KDO synthetase)
MSFKVVIPARYASTRFPGKVLADIKGKPMIQHVHERALSSGATEVWIATDEAKVADVALAFGARVCMTAATHQSGSDRIAEVIETLGWRDDDIIVNVQGDEPLLPPENIYQVAENIEKHRVSMATLATPLGSETLLQSPDVVKVVFDHQGFALYFSRTPIPHDRDGDNKAGYWRHIGLYAYRAAFLKDFTGKAQAPLELTEKLEQLRVLWYGERIHVDIARITPGPGVDTPADLERLLGAL